MSKVPRLPSVISRYIEEEWLKIETENVHIPDPSIPSEYNQQNLISPFRCFFTGRAIYDGFYTIPAITYVNISADSEILVTDWSLNYGPGINIIIKAAQTFSDAETTVNKLVEIPIERNFLVQASLRKYRFRNIKKGLESIFPEEGEKNEELFKILNEKKKSVEIKEERNDTRLDSDFDTVRKEKPFGCITLAHDLGFDEFPLYALEYLKHKYNVV